MSLLHRCARKGDDGAIADFLRIQGSVCVNVKDRHGLTPLHYALLHDHNSTAMLLVQSGGADVTVRDVCGRAPALMAFSIGLAGELCSDLSTEQAHTLIDDKGRGIVHYAASACDPVALKLALRLLDKPSDERKAIAIELPRDSQGQTPLHYVLGHPGANPRSTATDTVTKAYDNMTTPCDNARHGVTPPCDTTTNAYDNTSYLSDNATEAQAKVSQAYDIVPSACGTCLQNVSLLVDHCGTVEALFVPDYAGRTPVHIGGWRSKVHAMKQLKTLFVGEEKYRQLLNTPDFSGCTLLHMAYFRRDLDLATYLQIDMKLPFTLDGWRRSPADCRDTEAIDQNLEKWAELERLAREWTDANVESDSESKSAAPVPFQAPPFLTCNHGYSFLMNPQGDRQSRGIVPLSAKNKQLSTNSHSLELESSVAHAGPYGDIVNGLPIECSQQIIADDVQAFYLYRNRAARMGGCPDIISNLSHTLCPALTRLVQPLQTSPALQVRRIEDPTNPAYRPSRRARSRRSTCDGGTVRGVSKSEHAPMAELGGGFGLFAEAFVPKDTLIGEYCGEVVRLDMIESELAEDSDGSEGSEVRTAENTNENVPKDHSIGVAGKCIPSVDSVGYINKVIPKDYSIEIHVCPKSPTDDSYCMCNDNEELVVDGSNYRNALGFANDYRGTLNKAKDTSTATHTGSGTTADPDDVACNRASHRSICTNGDAEEHTIVNNSHSDLPRDRQCLAVSCVGCSRSQQKCKPESGAAGCGARPRCDDGLSQNTHASETVGIEPRLNSAASMAHETASLTDQRSKRKASDVLSKDRLQNTHFVQVMFRGWPRIVGVTIEDISAGDEILIDYGELFFQQHD
ncbi:hypothetical protein SARC_07640 [Sphaeroforma arctica JP610]|uniref:SET domain-containing protein n=1 Tax=Sphaeroforma arctica JP610 TaxID=667725 RepID=A0A0L0FT56_9EUKA|nr:hypothetical protein SARC_07640 [Sphaeroforma arctica JP610]KNC79985.1 hypothetical protein SARC_07640 [Sphaeroforma arctica JP610]|eukprot:XP_014153887.1 hypothetical protein SARC_07640 [Sphaeroforma arctica JP610]